MKIPFLIRANDWWEPKIVPLLVVGYMTVNHYHANIFTHFVWLLFLIMAISFGAIFVSILNDYTDFTYDLASKKSNRLESFSPLKRKLLLWVSIFTSIAVSFFFIDNILTLSFCLATYLAFSLYSIPPIRLKNRGLLGVIADASGAHLFVSLFIVTSMTQKMGKELDFFWLSVIGFWSLLYGLRGILWHQFLDRENDLSIHHPTFATSRQASSIKPAETLITIMEVGSLIILLISLGEWLPFLALAFYFLLLLGYQKLNQQVIFILVPNDKPWHIFLSDYYQILLPFSLLLSCSFENPTCLFLIIFHVLFFPHKLKLLVKNLLLMMRLERIK
jgi:hypothetical protein